MSQIELIRREVERLIEESDFDESANLYSLLAFLSNLEEQTKYKVRNPIFDECVANVDPEVREEVRRSIELEEEINRYLEPIHAADIQFEPFTQMTKCARHFAEFGYRYGFLEGAKTQREEDNQLVDTIYQQGIEKGKDEMREKAIEGHLFRYPPFTNPLISVSGINPEVFTNGDAKVKLIIIKEEER